MYESKGVKRIISITAAAVCMLSAVKFVPLSDNNVAVAADTLTAFEITEDMKIGWNLGNTLDATTSGATAGLESETAWGNPKATQELFDALKAKGFNTVRIPTTWYQHIDENNNIDPAWMARVHEVVDYAYKNDMYVILNLHHENWVNRADLGTAYDEMKVKLLALWTQIANEFKDYDQHLIFECMNEPRAVGTTHEWWGPEQSEVDTINKLNADFVELIRSIDSPYKDTRLLMVPDYCASSDISIMQRLVVPEDDYVAVSIHAYSPYGFTMDKSVEDHSTFSAAYQSELTNILGNIRKTFIEKDIPVVIGEFSASNYNNTEARCEWADLYISTTKAMGVPCVLWDNDARGNKDASERHDYIDRKNGNVWYPDSEQVVDTMMKVLADDSIVWGSEKYGKTYAHDDLSTGKSLFSGSSKLDAGHLGADGKQDQNCMNADCTWKDIEGGDIAVKFTGDAPAAIAFTNAAWGGWKEVNAYDVDSKNGIAYFSAKTVSDVWGEDALDDIAHLFVRADGVTTVEQIVVIGATSGDVTPVDKTKKYDIDFTKAKAGEDLVLSFEGEPGDANGCVGYMGDEWVNVKWEGTVGSDGKLEVRISRDNFPEGLTAAQAQIWYNPETLDMTGYKFEGQSATEPSSEDPTGTFSGIYGDANCDGVVDISDAVLIMQYMANPDKYPISEAGLAAADCVDAAKGITPTDALAIQMIEAKTINASELPVTAEYINSLVK